MMPNLIASVVLLTSLTTGCGASAPSPVSAASGIKGTTRSVTVSGLPGGQTSGGPVSLEFAVAPISNGAPAFEAAIFAKSDAEGLFQVDLPPGTYWIGPPEKARTKSAVETPSVVFSERIVTVEPGAFVSVELVQTWYAP